MWQSKQFISITPDWDQSHGLACPVAGSRMLASGPLTVAFSSGSPVARGGGRAAAGDARAVHFQPFGRGEIQPLVARLRQIAVGQRVELAEQAVGGVPGRAGSGLAGWGQVAQAQVGVEGVLIR